MDSFLTAFDIFKSNGVNSSSVSVSKSVTKIERNAFKGCDFLKGFAIPNTVTEIEECAFSECKALEKIIIPTSVFKIGDNAFAGCNELKNIQFNGRVYNSVENFMKAFNLYRSYARSEWRVIE